LFELSDLALDEIGLSSGAGRELHDDEQSDERHKQDDYREGPRNDAITKRS